MKILNYFLIVAVCLSLCYACAETFKEPINELKGGKLGADKSHETKMVTVPFKAEFTVWRELPRGTGDCEPGSERETMMMKGKGKAAHLGQLKEIFMTFCTQSDGTYSFVDLEPGKFVAANGDELYFMIYDGQIVFPYTGDNPEYQAQFDDEMVFIGGTGRFDGAYGSAKTNAYVHGGSTDNDGDDPFYTDFFMTEGTITMKKGKRMHDEHGHKHERGKRGERDQDD